MLRLFPYFLIVFLTGSLINPASAQNTIVLTWNDVVGISRIENLDLAIQKKEYQYQKYNEWKAISDFLPSVDYQYQVTKNIELPVFVFEIQEMGQTVRQEVRVGADYNFTHAFQLSLPIFTGGSRFANWRIQKNLKKSVREQLRDKEDDIVLQSLEAYFNLMLASSLIDVNSQSVEAAKANLDQVEKFYEAGAASKLDYLRAKARYSSTLPPMTTAVNSKKMAEQNLKFLLNIDKDDSLVVLDQLKQMMFLDENNLSPLSELQENAITDRPDIAGMEFQNKAVGDQRIIAASRFLPSVAMNASVQHQAQSNTSDVSSEDYIRVKSATLSVQLPLFEGGKRLIDLQQSKIKNKQSAIQLDLLKKSIYLDVENNYNRFREARTNLVSLKEASEETKEALRLADLNYREGIITQVEVLTAQLSFITSEEEYRNGIYQYNVSQLRLLRSIGKLKTIWNQQENNHE
ncbi:MAG: TolC family protein [Calditrichaceae bacterium]